MIITLTYSIDEEIGRGEDISQHGTVPGINRGPSIEEMVYSFTSSDVKDDIGVMWALRLELEICSHMRGGGGDFLYICPIYMVL